MVNYSISEPRRIPVWLLIGVIASALVGILQSYKLTSWYQLWAPSALMVFATLLALFDWLFRKFRFISFLTSIPNFSGSYICALVREKEDRSQVETTATCLIQQSFLRISIRFEGRGCISHATCASITIQGDDIAELEWCYQAHDITGSPTAGKYHPGTTQLHYTKDNGKVVLKGRYFTSNGRRGSIRMEAV